MRQATTLSSQILHKRQARPITAVLPTFLPKKGNFAFFLAKLSRERNILVPTLVLKTSHRQS